MLIGESIAVKELLLYSKLKRRHMYSNHKHPTTHSLDDDLLGSLALSLRVFVRQELYLRRQRRCKPRALWVSQHARLEVLPDSFDALAQSDIFLRARRQPCPDRKAVELRSRRHDYPCD